MSPLFPGCFLSDPFELAGQEEMRDILDVFEFWPDWTTDKSYLPLSIQKYIYLVENYSNYFMSYWLSCERSLPFGLPV